MTLDLLTSSRRRVRKAGETPALLHQRSDVAEQAARFDKTPVAHDGANFGPNDVGDEPQGRRGPVPRGARRPDGTKGGTGPNPVHAAEIKTRPRGHSLGAI